MKTKELIRELYHAPLAQVIDFRISANLLVTLSIEGDVEDFEDGGDL
ncbi:hypothetical protein [Porphyromonas sp. COT-290 OH860]|nr:hypothetical protein [Porphyromonas sp. COT-290 OH860]